MRKTRKSQTVDVPPGITCCNNAARHESVLICLVSLLMEEKMKILEAMNTACRDLPDGYQVCLYMENGAAWVELITPEGTQHVEHDENFADAIISAVAQAHGDVED